MAWWQARPRGNAPHDGPALRPGHLPADRFAWAGSALCNRPEPGPGKARGVCLHVRDRVRRGGVDRRRGRVASLHAKPHRAGPHGSSRGRDLCRAWARGGGDRSQEAVGIASGEAGLPRGALAAATMIGIPSTSPRHVSEITIPSARATHRAHGERRATPTIATIASPKRATKTSQKMIPATKFGSSLAEAWLRFWTSPRVPNRLSIPVNPASSPRKTSKNVRRPGDGAQPDVAGGGME